MSLMSSHDMFSWRNQKNINTGTWLKKSTLSRTMYSTIYSVKFYNKQRRTVQMYRLIMAFSVCICSKIPVCGLLHSSR